MRKKYLILMFAVSLSLSACGSKADNTDETTAPVESTEDPFSLGGIDINAGEGDGTAETEPATEVEVLETFADGSKTSLYSDGSIRNTSNIDDLPSVDKLSEEEHTYLEAVVANIGTSISTKELDKYINTEKLKSLSDTECESTGLFTRNPQFYHIGKMIQP